MNENDLGKELAVLFGAAAKDFGRELVVAGKALADYTAKQLRQLALARGEPGFERIAQAAKDNIILEAAGHAVDRADSFDQRLAGIVDAAISIGLRVLGV